VSTIDLIINEDKYQFGHGERYRQRGNVINTHFVVSSITPSSSSSSIVFEHRGTIQFGPITEREHLEQLYDEYFDEYSRIGMCDLQYDTAYFQDKYNDCVYHMNLIDYRIDALIV
jgi:hypothetical protein